MAIVDMVVNGLLQTVVGSNLWLVLFMSAYWCYGSKFWCFCFYSYGLSKFVHTKVGVNNGS